MKKYMIENAIEYNLLWKRKWKFWKKFIDENHEASVNRKSDLNYTKNIDKMHNLIHLLCMILEKHIELFY